jgi:hypothetical protein
MRFAEVQYYFRLQIQDEPQVLCMLKLYSDCDRDLYTRSSGTVYACHLGAIDFQVVKVSAIHSVIAMIPYPLSFVSLHPGLGERFAGTYFVVERPGLDMSSLGELLEDDASNVFSL